MSEQAFIDQYDSARSGCIVLDVRLPMSRWLKFRRHREAVRCTMPVVFVSVDEDAPASLEVLHGHDFDVFDKPLASAALLDCIREALQWCEQHCSDEAQQQEAQQRYYDLTGRERDVMQRMALGLSSKRIAAELGVSPRTVDIYRSRVRTRMHANSVADLVRLSLMIGHG